MINDLMIIILTATTITFFCLLMEEKEKVKRIKKRLKRKSR